MYSHSTEIDDMTLAEELKVTRIAAAQAFLLAWTAYSEAKQYVFSDSAKYAELMAKGDKANAEGEEAAEHAHFLEWAENMEIAYEAGYF